MNCYQSYTELSNELRNIKNNYHTPSVTWRILRKYQPDNPTTKRCSLCSKEKLEIAIHKGNNLLNKTSEIVN